MPAYDIAPRNTMISKREGAILSFPNREERMPGRRIIKTRGEHLRRCQRTQEIAVKCTDLLREPDNTDAF